METIITEPLRIKRFVACLLYFNAIVLVLSGCTPGLIHVDLSKVDAPLPEEASIIVIRPAYLSYAARDLTITANNSQVADLFNLSYTSFQMPPGKLKLSGEGGFFSWPYRETSINVEKGKTYYLEWAARETASSRLMMMLFPTLDLNSLGWQSISKDAAQSLLGSTHYVEPRIQEIP